MSNWRNDPEGAADQLIRRSLDDIEVRGRVLLAYQAGDLPALLTQRGVDVAVWNRRALADRSQAAPWPSAGPYDVALLRLPKAKDEQEMAAHACLERARRGRPSHRLRRQRRGHPLGCRHAGGVVRQRRYAGDARPRPRAGGAPAERCVAPCVRR